MKRGNEFAVGLAVLAALALVIGGALWLSETDVKQKKTIYAARFRTIGGLGVGAPVTLRGVRVGRVEAIRLVEDEWVETEFSIDRDGRAARAARGDRGLGEPLRRVGRQHHPLRAAPDRPEPAQRAARVRPRKPGRRLARRYASRHRPTHRAGQPHRRRRRRHHRPHRAGVRQRGAQGHAAERQEPRRDLEPPGAVRGRADDADRQHQRQRRQHVELVRQHGADVRDGGGPAGHARPPTISSSRS